MDIREAHKTSGQSIDNRRKLIVCEVYLDSPENKSKRPSQLLLDTSVYNQRLTELVRTDWGRLSRCPAACKAHNKMVLDQLFESRGSQ